MPAPEQKSPSGASMREVEAPAALADDWPRQAADTIVEIVGQVRAKTTGPVITAARAVVFGLVIAVLAVVGISAGLVAAVRSTQILVEWIADAAGSGIEHERAVWISYLVAGSVFTLAGLLLWRVANRRAVSGSDASPERGQ